MRVDQKKPTRSDDRNSVNPARPTFIPRLDSGVQDVEESKEDSGPAVEIRMVNDVGIQTVEANEKAVGQGRKL